MARPEEPVLPPICDTPECERVAPYRFLGLTPLCRDHAARANRRAKVNVLISGGVFVVIGLALAAAFDWSRAQALAGIALTGVGLLLSASGLVFRRRARELEAEG